MPKFETLETQIANLVRVYGARNERDLAEIMKTMQSVVEHTKTLEARIAEFENRSGHGYVEDRTAYLGIK